MMNLRRLPTPSSRRLLIITIILVLIMIVGGGYVLWSKQTWERYTPTYTGWHDGLGGSIDKIASSSVGGGDAQAAAGMNAQLKDIAKQIHDKQATICKVNPLIDWQRQFVTPFKEAYVACTKMTADLREFQTQLTIVTAYNDDDQKLAKIISTLPQAGELKDVAWPNQPQVWDTSITAVKDSPVSDAFKPTQRRAIEKLAAVKLAWQEVNATNQAKDKVKYTAASIALGSSYDGLSEIATTSEATLANLTKILEIHRQQAFH